MKIRKSELIVSFFFVRFVQAVKLGAKMKLFLLEDQILKGIYIYILREGQKFFSTIVNDRF